LAAVQLAIATDAAAIASIAPAAVGAAVATQNFCLSQIAKFRATLSID
jgi:hypothetical protein